MHSSLFCPRGEDLFVFGNAPEGGIPKGGGAFICRFFPVEINHSTQAGLTTNTSNLARTKVTFLENTLLQKAAHQLVISTRRRSLPTTLFGVSTRAAVHSLVNM